VRRIVLVCAAAVAAAFYIGWASGAAVESARATSFGKTDVDYQAAAALMALFDHADFSSVDSYTNELRWVAPKCNENVAALATLFEQEAASQSAARGYSITAYQMLNAYNTMTAKRVDAGNCTLEVQQFAPVLAR